jgi:MOSC domain-containing protein YiiM
VNATGRLEAIWIKRGKGGPMDGADEATLLTGRGIEHNANQGGHRQVTIITRERWEAVCFALDADLPPETRRANLLVSGIDLEKTRGRFLRIGRTRLQINGETRPCWQMEEAHPGLQAALDPRWGGGAFAEVIDGGAIRVGDLVLWEPTLLDAGSAGS